MGRLPWNPTLLFLFLVACSGSSVDEPDTADPSDEGRPKKDPSEGPELPEDSPLDCGADLSADTPDPGDVAVCVTQEIGCGEEVMHTLAGGTTLYDRSFWAAQQTLGGLTGKSADVLDGPERVYIIRPDTPGRSVELRLESCFEGWASWRRYGDVAFDWCDVDDHWATAGHFLSESAWVRTYEFLHDAGKQYEVIVEGLDGAVGNFRLVVTCE